MPTDDDRARRVKEGSRRKRDFAAVARIAENQEAAPVERELLDAWVKVRQVIRRNSGLPYSSYALWMKPLRPVALEDGTLFLRAPKYVATWVDRRYTRFILEVIEGLIAAKQVKVLSPGDLVG